MHKPTDEEISRLCAEVCGTLKRTRVSYLSTEMEGHNEESFPAYTTDRNALPELWQKVEEAGIGGRYETYVLELGAMLPLSKGPCHSHWIRITALPRLHCIAALKALGHWPDDEWSDEV